MSARFVKWLPMFTALVVVAVVLLAQFLFVLNPQLSLFEQLELLTFDWREQRAHDLDPQWNNKLGFIAISEHTLNTLNRPELGTYQWPFPRSLHAMLIEELSAQGADTVCFDVLFNDRERDYAENRVTIPSGEELSSSEFFAYTMEKTGNVILGAANRKAAGEDPELLLPLPEYAEAAVAVGQDGMRRADCDKIFRRVKAFYDEIDHGRFWHMGILCAARLLDVDLSNAEILEDRIVLPVSPKDGIRRVIPIDSDQRLYVDWNILIRDENEHGLRIGAAHYVDILRNHAERQAGNQVPSHWIGKAAIIGATGAGSNVTDRGATPVGGATALVSSIWNVANSVLTNRFIHRASYFHEMLLILLMAGVAAALNWRLPALVSSLFILILASAYIFLADYVFLRYRLWLPIVLPLAGALLMSHVAMVSCRALLEYEERKRIREVFGGAVSLNTLSILLDRPPRSLDGTRRNLTVLFADVRGFTDFFEKCSLEAENYVKENMLSEDLADEYIERNAKDVLLTINKYLCVIADVIKKHDGTLDKYIGDCVMAFWGAPMEKEHHAHACIQAAIEIQQAVNSLNQECERSNREMPKRDEEGEPSLNAGNTYLPILDVGCALGSGWATAGCMGSENHLSNYTVFGQIVNIVSRLESIARGGEIIATESTFNEIIRDHPGLAASFLPREPVSLRGIQHPIPVYEIPWAIMKTE